VRRGEGIMTRMTPWLWGSVMETWDLWGEREVYEIPRKVLYNMRDEVRPFGKLFTMIIKGLALYKDFFGSGDTICP
jgi:hypothetical protein